MELPPLYESLALERIAGATALIKAIATCDCKLQADFLHQTCRIKAANMTGP
jgi:hypothetical protein